MSASRITRSGRDWIAPPHSSAWQAERAAGPLLPMQTGSEFTGRRAPLMWLWWFFFVTIAICVGLS